MNEQQLLRLALGKPPGERAAFLEQACGADAALRRRVEALLHNPPALDRPPAAPEATSAATPGEGESGSEGPPFVRPGPRPVTEGPGDRIGPYKLLQQIGEGGMGVVFMAEQTQPVHRRVALKVIKPGMDSAQVVARFEAERQALALMDHPNIARVLDADTTAAGRPYFVMELVHGVPITRYCDENRLTPRERLELFVPVCRAVQHAHTKGVIHRDLKPSNILVTLHDGKPVPKIIDFGVAKAVEQRLTERTMFTQYGTAVGTLEYMAPEQAEMSGLGVDTRSDVYSLGVLLYELLTGTTPLDRSRLRRAAYTEAVRLIKEEEPPRPSARMSTTQERASIAAHRRTEPARLARLLRGELDWVVMKCLEKDRTRRYETANGLARDVERYLADEPVEACPPSAAYRLGKLARRHKKALGAAAAFALLLAAGAAVSAWQALRATRAEQAAVAAYAAEAEQRREAQEQRDRAQAAERQAQQRLEESLRAQERARERFRLARAAVDQFHTRVADSPELKAQGQEALRTRLLEGAADFYEKLVREEADDPGVRAERGRGYARLARLYSQTGRTDRAEKTFQEGIAIQRRLREASPDDPESRGDLARSLHDLGEFYFGLGKHAECEKAYRESLGLFRDLAKAYPDRPEYQRGLAETHNDLAALYTYDSFDKALAAWKEALAVAKPLADLRPDDAEAQNLLGTIYINLNFGYRGSGRPDLAEPPAREAVATFRGLVAANPDVLDYQEGLGAALSNLARSLADKNQAEGAEAAYREGAAVLRKAAEAHPHVPDLRNKLASVLSSRADLLSRTGRPGEAEAPLQEALELSRRLRAAHPRVHQYALTAIVIANRLGEFYQQTNRASQAEATWKDAMALHREIAVNSLLALDGFRLNGTCSGLAGLYHAAGRAADEVQVWAEAAGLMKQRCDADPNAESPRIWLAGFQGRLAQLYRDGGQTDRAVAAAEEALAGRKKLAAAKPAFRGSVAEAQNLLTDLYREAGRPEAALPLMRDVVGEVERLAQAKPQDPVPQQNLAVSRNNLAVCYREAGRPEAGLPLMEEAVEHGRRRAEAEPQNPALRGTLAVWRNNLAVLYRDVGRGDEARAAAEEAVRDFDRGLAAAPAASKPVFRALRAGALARLGDHARAAAEADELTKAGSPDANTLYQLARAYSQAALAARQDTKLSEAERARAAAAHAERAVELLRKAAETKQFRSAGNVKRLREEKDLDPLRDRDDFKKLLDGLAKPNPSGK
jgi:serine/threonine protein kinase/tetratricopeptide (TPR) repeat protein